jgi:hypothetical protein
MDNEMQFAAYAQPGARKMAHTILWDEFVPLTKQVPGTLSPVALLEVPAGQLLLLEPKMFGLVLKAEHKVSFAASAPLTMAVNLRTAGHRPMRTAQRAPNFPSSSHPDVVVWISSDNGTTYTKTEVNSFDPETGIIDFDKTALTNHAAIYFVPGDGEIVLSADRPTGSDRVNARLYNNTTRGLFSKDQDNERSAVRFDREKGLAPFWKLSIEMSTASKVVWTPRAEHYVLFPAQKLAIDVTQRQMLDQAVERALRGGVQ